MLIVGASCLISLLVTVIGLRISNKTNHPAEAAPSGTLNTDVHNQPDQGGEKN